MLECKRVYKAKENDRRRDLKCWSRWETDTPDRRVKLNPDNCTFTEETAQVAECDGQHAEYPPSGLTWADWAVQAVEKVGHPATREEMLVAWPGSKMGPTRLDNIIRNSLKAARLLKQGVGVKGKPQRYSSADVSPTLSGAEELNATPTASNNDSSAQEHVVRGPGRIDDLALFAPPLRLAGGGAA